jgi:hypothetical protein
MHGKTTIKSLAKLFHVGCFSDSRWIKQVEKKLLLLHLFWDKSPELYTSLEKLLSGMAYIRQKYKLVKRTVK